MKIIQPEKYFNKAENSYDENCLIQSKSAEILLELIKKYRNNFSKFQIIIELGCGTGIFTKKILDQYPDFEEFYAIDIAEKLLEKARFKMKNYKIKFLKENFEKFSENLEGKIFDQIFSNMALQWSNNLKNNINYLKKKIKLGGIFAFSIPLNKTFTELSELKKIWLLSEQEIINILKKENLLLLESQKFTEIYSFNSLREALNSIKLVGANYSDGNLDNLSLIRNLCEKESKKLNKIFNLTYEIGIFITKRSE